MTSDIADQVLELVTRAKIGISPLKLARDLKLSSSELDEAIDLLITDDEIEQKRIARSVFYVPVSKKVQVEAEPTPAPEPEPVANTPAAVSEPVQQFPPIPDVKAPAGNKCGFCGKELVTPGKARMHENLCGKNPDSKRNNKGKLPKKELPGHVPGTNEDPTLAAYKEAKERKKQGVRNIAEQEVNEVLQPNGEPKMSVAEAAQKAEQLLEAERAMECPDAAGDPALLITGNAVYPMQYVKSTTSTNNAGWSSTIPMPSIGNVTKASDTFPIESLMEGLEEATENPNRRPVEVQFAFKSALERESKILEIINARWGGIQAAQHEATWDDEARTDMRALRTATRERSEYQTILDRMKAEGAI